MSIVAAKQCIKRIGGNNDHVGPHFYKRRHSSVMTDFVKLVDVENHSDEGDGYEYTHYFFTHQ